MNPNSLIVRYKHLFPELKRLSRAENVITDANVYQPANPEIRKIMDQMCEENMLPNSQFRNMNHAEEFLAKIKEGKRGIILMEHYSNFDLPGIMYLLTKAGKSGKELADRIIAIAGMKLNEENQYVSAFAEAYTRVIIYPSRSLAAITAKGKRVEYAVMRKLNEGVYMVAPVDESDADQTSRAANCKQDNNVACRVERREQLLALARATAAKQSASGGLVIRLADTPEPSGAHKQPARRSRR